MLKEVDINCDLGEGKTLQDCELDAQLMPFISRCNIACGGHAGNPTTMLATLNHAKRSGIQCGAHPSYPDPANFGRQSMHIPLKNLLDNLLAQIAQLDALASKTQQSLSHVKLHGALYNDAEKSPQMAHAICQGLAQHYPQLTILGLPNAAMQSAALAQKLPFMAEGFMDRAYLATGHLAPRSLAGAVYQQVEVCIEQVMAMLMGKPLKVLQAQPHSNTQLSAVIISPDTFCLHGDSVIAHPLIEALHQTLSRHGYAVI
ncbi:LamB/YcsF family protein [Paraglaciecola aquimarina]|uniref:LamB/YcsF family protein n=1 Tax=Paraglaciecola aquimarina TaxID=1235557 RepID=A0ABU3T1E8_9ALTE|nr:LamB/YcsF family protein [Paraglaciecola aquimarina]MDU0356033.1 LamB/YcsF family protein [Paraglaciecola aquimarina]